MTAAKSFPPPSETSAIAPKSISGRPTPRAWVEMSALPASLVLELPCPPTLTLHVPGVTGVVRVHVDGELEAPDADAAEIVFDADEWCALVLGVEADRVWPMDLVTFCRRKAAEPAWRLEPREALAGAQPDPRERWTLADVLERLDVSLLGCELH